MKLSIIIIIIVIIIIIIAIAIAIIIITLPLIVKSPNIRPKFRVIYVDDSKISKTWTGVVVSAISSKTNRPDHVPCCFQFSVV